MYEEYDFLIMMIILQRWRRALSEELMRQEILVDTTSNILSIIILREEKWRPLKMWTVWLKMWRRHYNLAHRVAETPSTKSLLRLKVSQVDIQQKIYCLQIEMCERYDPCCKVETQFRAIVPSKLQLQVQFFLYRLWILLQDLSSTWFWE